MTKDRTIFLFGGKCESALLAPLFDNIQYNKGDFTQQGIKKHTRTKRKKKECDFENQLLYLESKKLKKT